MGFDVFGPEIESPTKANLKDLREKASIVLLEGEGNIKSCHWVLGLELFSTQRA
jgi:hypothetical protein